MDESKLREFIRNEVTQLREAEEIRALRDLRNLQKHFNTSADIKKLGEVFKKLLDQLEEELGIRLKKNR